jgi:hypothetical protein
MAIRQSQWDQPLCRKTHFCVKKCDQDHVINNIFQKTLMFPNGEAVSSELRTSRVRLETYPASCLLLLQFLGKFFIIVNIRTGRIFRLFLMKFLFVSTILFRIFNFEAYRTLWRVIGTLANELWTNKNWEICPVKLWVRIKAPLEQLCKEVQLYVWQNSLSVECSITRRAWVRMLNY